MIHGLGDVGATQIKTQTDCVFSSMAERCLEVINPLMQAHPIHKFSSGSLSEVEGSGQSHCLQDHSGAGLPGTRPAPITKKAARPTPKKHTQGLSGCVRRQG